MTRRSITAHVAPHMGTFDQGKQAFAGAAPPYARGGGVPATRHLQDVLLTHMLRYQAVEEVTPPSIIITPNGQAANHGMFRSLWGGDMVSSKALFGTTKQALLQTFERVGGNKLDFVDPCDTQAFIDLTTDNTTAWFLEAVSNPTGRVAKLKELYAAAKERNVLVVLDATLAACMPNFDPLQYSDVITASMSKQLGGGQNLNMGGVIIVKSDIEWERHVKKFRELTHYFTNAAALKEIQHNPLGSLVAKIGLQEGFNSITPSVALSIANLLPSVRGNVEKMCANAKMVAQLLDNHPAIGRVQLAGYKTDTQNDARMREYFGESHFVIVADLKGGVSAAQKFTDTEEFLHAVALGQVETAISNPASSTHRQYPKDELAAMGFNESTIRISVGTEDPDELSSRMLKALEP